MVEGADVFEQGLDVGFERAGVGEVAGVAGEARGRGWVAGCEARDGGGEAGRGRGGERDCAAVFEAGFGDAEADAAGAADDQDAGVVQFGGVVLGVCHGGCGGGGVGVEGCCGRWCLDGGF